MSQPVVSVVGLGYVGLPLAVEFARSFRVIGFDINSKRVKALRNGVDITGEVESEGLNFGDIKYTDQAEDIREANFHIVAVPTPISSSKQPDLGAVKSACQTLGQQLKGGDYVVFESTVYPGATEEDCLPILEELSGLKAGRDFKIGYSPERINPGDRDHTFRKIIKVVSGMDKESLDHIAEVYGSVVEAGVFKAESIRVAEAAKVIENSQRDLNVAFVNELSMIFNKMGLDTKAVLRAANTKWNFLNFSPGLVGGHCIGVDPFYLTYKAELMGYHPEVILSGRRINDNMGKFVAKSLIDLLIKSDLSPRDCHVNLLGLTFKENCPDTRNTKVVDIYRELSEYGIPVSLIDPLADPEDIEEEFGQKPTEMKDMKAGEVLLLAVKHDVFFERGQGFFSEYLKGPKVFIDLKGQFEKGEVEGNDGKYWRL